MPKRSADQGSKPFDFRTGMAGLPAFGGMFRAGDPAIVPPQKFHVLVNMRVEPMGLITRPGLALEFDTGVQECINGLTEDAGEQGGAIMLYPGATGVQANGTPGFNSATFRAIFPDSSIDYSEYVYVPYGLPATDRGTLSPVLAYIQSAELFERPFIFRGQAVQFKFVQRNGVDTVALLGMNLPGRAFLQAADCSRLAFGPGDNFSTGGPCPGVSGMARPASPTAQPLWPYDYPVGSSNVLVYFDSPWFPDFWQPDGTSPALIAGVEFFLTRQERINDPLTGLSGVSEVLYFIAVNGVMRKLVRWDGAQQTTEAIAIPDGVQPVIGDQTYGPYLAATDSTAGGGGPNDWAGVRGPSGSWSVIGGVDAIPAGIFYPLSGLVGATIGRTWAGLGHVFVQLYYEDRLSVTDIAFAKLQVFRQGTADFNTVALTIVDVNCELPCAVGFGLIAAVISADLAYALVEGGAEASFSYLVWGSLVTGLAGPAAIPLGQSSFLWLQVIGGRVYLGGPFQQWNPASGFAEPGVIHHGVYDVTDPTSIFNVYRVTETAQLEDAGYAPGARYSHGALSAVPNDDTGGEGFQAS